VGTPRHRLTAAALALLVVLLAAGEAVAVRPGGRHLLDPRQTGLSYEEVRFPALGDSAELHGWWFPAGDSAHVVVLCPRGRGTMADLLPAAREFAQRGFAVLLFDYRDFGPHSAGEQDSLRHVVFASRWVDDTRGALAWARQRAPGRAVLAWGHDLGAATAVAAAARDRALVDALAVGNLFASTQEQIRHNGTSVIAGVPERHRRLVLGHDEPISAVPMLQVPMLAILALRDDERPADRARAVVQRSLTRIDRWVLPEAGRDEVEQTPGYYDRVSRWFKQMIPLLRPFGRS
jgi:pimeloyl-ACP methyl ester carboxylesterase